MGLDVYLRRYEDFETDKELEKRYSEESEKLWNGIAKGREYKNVPEAERDEYRETAKGLAEALGLDQYGTSRRSEDIERPIQNTCARLVTYVAHIMVVDLIV